MEPIDTDGSLRGSRDRHSAGEHAVIAPLEQLFTGLRVGLSTLTVQCCACRAELGEGNIVPVSAYRTVEAPRWQLARCRYPVCGGRHPNTNPRHTEVRLTAQLAVVSDM